MDTGEPTARHDGERRLVFAEDFDGPDLDRSVWLPHYLPAWSSRRETAATYELRDSCLQLSIPLRQGLWCGNDHAPALRVSGIQSANLSGPVGSTLGQQPYRDGLVVREQQEPFYGWTPDGGYIELRARALITPRSMVGFWMSGLEDRPERSAEICVAEIFGDAVSAGRSAAVGLGTRAFRDPDVAGDFEAVRLDIDVREFHTYAVDWTPDLVTFFVDGATVRSCTGPPSYPMQVMLAVFDFPDRSTGHDADEVPVLVVDHLRGYAR